MFLHHQPAGQTASSGLSPPLSPPLEGWAEVAGWRQQHGVRLSGPGPGGPSPQWSTYIWEVGVNVVPHLAVEEPHTVRTSVSLKNILSGAEYSHRSGFLLGEDPDEEVGLVVWLKGGGDQQVIPRRQREALRHLPRVDVGPAASLGRVVAEVVFPGVILVVWSLNVRRHTQRHARDQDLYV